MRRQNVRNLRNDFDFNVPNYRLQSTLNSYFPSTIRLWDNLEPEIRHNYTLQQFKSIINNRRDRFIIPPYRQLENILLTRLRNSCSNLNAALFRVNLLVSPSCTCGYGKENVFHFLLNVRCITTKGTHSVKGYSTGTVRIRCPIYGDCYVRIRWIEYRTSTVILSYRIDCNLTVSIFIRRNLTVSYNLPKVSSVVSYFCRNLDKRYFYWDFMSFFE